MIGAAQGPLKPKRAGSPVCRHQVVQRRPEVERPVAREDEGQLGRIGGADYRIGRAFIDGISPSANSPLVHSGTALGSPPYPREDKTVDPSTKPPAVRLFMACSSAVLGSKVERGRQLKWVRAGLRSGTPPTLSGTCSNCSGPTASPPNHLKGCLADSGAAPPPSATISLTAPDFAHAAVFSRSIHLYLFVRREPADEYNSLPPQENIHPDLGAERPHCLRSRPPRSRRAARPIP